MAQNDRKHATRHAQVQEICKECGRTLSEPHLPEFAERPSPADSPTPSLSTGVSIPVGRVEANLHRLVSSLCDSREVDLLKAAQANLQALVQIARQRTSKRKR